MIFDIFNKSTFCNIFPFLYFHDSFFIFSNFDLDSCGSLDPPLVGNDAGYKHQIGLPPAGPPPLHQAPIISTSNLPPGSVQGAMTGGLTDTQITANALQKASMLPSFMHT